MGVPWWKLLSFIDSLPLKVSSPFCGLLLPLQSPYTACTFTCTCTCAHAPCRFYGLPNPSIPPTFFGNPLLQSVHECRVVESWLPYSGKFSTGPIFAVFADDRLTAKIKPSK